MIEPVTAWWILFTVMLIGAAVTTNEMVKKDSRTETIFLLVFQGIMFYCLYVIKGVI